MSRISFQGLPLSIWNQVKNIALIQHQKITAIALLAFSFLVVDVTYLYRNYFKTKYKTSPSFLQKPLEESASIKLHLETTKKTTEIAQSIYPLPDLPGDIIGFLYSKLDLKSFLNLSQTSKMHYQVLRRKETKKNLLNLINQSMLSVDAKVKIAKQLGSDLISLNFKNLKVNDSQLQEIFKTCPHLKILILSNCILLTEASFKNLPKNLHTLDISSCYIDHEMMLHFPSTLQVLKVAYCKQLTDKADFSHLSQLRSLDVSSCSIEDQTLLTLSSTLQVLDVKDNKLKTTANFSHLNQLQALNLHGCLVKDQTIRTLPPTLQKLYMGMSRFSANVDFSHLNQLQSLALSFCTLSHQTVLTFPLTLQSLDMTMCTPITTPLNFSHLNQLQSLNLGSFHWDINDQTLTYLPITLQSLSIPCFKENHLTAAADFSQFKHLESLDLSNCAIEDYTLHSLPPHLKYLSVSGCKRLTAHADFSQFKHLESLDLSHCAIEDHTLQSLPPHLKSLRVKGCDKLTDHAALRQYDFKTCDRQQEIFKI